MATDYSTFDLPIRTECNEIKIGEIKIKIKIGERKKEKCGRNCMRKKKMKRKKGKIELDVSIKPIFVSKTCFNLLR